MTVGRSLRTEIATRRNCIYWVTCATTKMLFPLMQKLNTPLYISFPRLSNKGRLRNGVGVHISLVIHCHLLTCTWSREAGWVETHSPSIRLFTFKGKVHTVSISYQRIKHVWCERICDLDTQGAYLQRKRYGFFT